MDRVLTEQQVKSLFPKRKADANKSDFGYIALVGGCRRYSGAIRLADMAASAMRSGAGVCAVAAPDNICDIIASNILESTLIPLSSANEHIRFVGEEFEEIAERYDVIAFGMGIGLSSETKKALQYLLENYDGTLIVDADGINALAKLDREAILARSCDLIITPHMKEFARMAKCEVDDVRTAPLEKAKALAKELECIVLLKGHTTYVTDGTESYTVERGVPGMATAGSGDVLSGILAAVAASNPDRLLLATAGAAYINGLAGELAEEDIGEVSLIASDTARHVKKALAIILGHEKAPRSVHQTRRHSVFGKLVAAILIIALATGAVWFGAGYLSKIVPNNEVVSTFDHIVTMHYMSKDIYIDGKLVNNYQIYRPFTELNNRTYVPLTDDVCAALGFKASWDHENQGVIYIEKTEPTGEGVFFADLAWDLEDVTAWSLSSGKLVLGSPDEEPSRASKIFGGIMRVFKGASGDIVLGGEEAISYADGAVMYVPLYRLLEIDELGLSSYYETVTGLYISTDPGIGAENYFSENNEAYILGRAEYINSNQKNLTMGECCLYEYYFRHAAIINGLDEDFLMALAKQESSFDTNDTSATGALGIMQVTRSTARDNGMNPADLYIPHKNIDFGSNYIKNFIAIYKGNVTLALTAYNQGAGAVQSGEYSTGYANSVLSKQSDIKSRMESRGYSNEFLTVLECTK